MKSWTKPRATPRSPKQWRSLNWQLLAALTGVTLVSLTSVVSVVIWETRSILAEQKGKSFEALATSGSQRLAEELAREVELLEGLSQENAFFYEVFGNLQDGWHKLSDADLAAELQRLEDAWQQGDEALQVKTRGHPASTHLLRFTRKFSAHTQLIYTNRYGTLVASSGSRPEHFFYGDTAWWQAGWGEGRGQVFVQQLPPIPGQAGTMIEIAVPVRLLADQQSHGVLRSRFLIHDFNVFEDLSTLQDISGVTIIDASGTVVHSDTTDQIGLTTAAPGERAGWQRQRGTEGNNIISGYAPLPASREHAYLDNLGWTLQVHQSARMALATADRLTLVAILGGVGVLVIALVVSHRITQQFTRPIRSLTQTATAMAAGDLEGRAALMGAHEFQTLAQAFNSMTQLLRQSIVTLEQRVQERTPALASA